MWEKVRCRVEHKETMRGNIAGASLPITSVTLGALRKLQGDKCPSNIFSTSEQIFGY